MQHFSVHYLKKLELLNRLHSFMDQFVRYIHRKVCSYPVFNIFAQLCTALKYLGLWFDGKLTFKEHAK